MREASTLNNLLLQKETELSGMADSMHGAGGVKMEQGILLCDIARKFVGKGHHMCAVFDIHLAT